jgi:excisionase family DNA binding protein
VRSPTGVAQSLRFLRTDSGPARRKLQFGFFSVIAVAAFVSKEAAMGAAQAKFDRFDENTKLQLKSVAKALGEDDGRRITLAVEGNLAKILRRFITTASKSDGVAYCPLESELSPEQAGKILGVSRPLVVQRMDDGRLPFHYVGSHRRCSLSDVLKLKEKEDPVNEALAQLYEQHEAIENARRR